MKFEERIVIPCTLAFKERIEKAVHKEAQGLQEVPNVALIARRELDAYADRVLLPADHPRNQNGSTR